jgi:hypothetical protein
MQIYINYYITFEEYNNLFMELKNYFPYLLEKKILLSEIGIHPRTHIAWKEEGLTFYEGVNIVLNEKLEKRKWVYLDIFEALWLLIIVELRKFSLDLKTIKKLKEFIKEQPDVKSALEKISEEDFQNKVVSLLTKEMLESIGGSTSREKVIKSLTRNLYQDTFLSNLGVLLYGALITNSSPSIIIKINKEADEFEFIIAINNSAEAKLKEELYEFYTKTCSESTFINLPIVTILEKLFENEKIINHCYEYGFFNNQERQLLDAVRNKECEEIKIAKHPSGDYTVNFSDAKDISGEEAKKLRKTLGLKMYDRVEVIYRNESHLVIKNTNKKVIKRE